MNDYRLKYSVVAADGDLSALRASPGWRALAATLAGAPATLAGAPGGGAGVAAAAVRLRTEAKSPFRTLTLFLLAGLGAGAALAAFVTAPQLLKAALGGAPAPPPPGVDGPPPDGSLLTTAGNMAVDVAVLAAAVWLFRRETAARDAQEAVVAREEALGALAVSAASASSAGAGAGAAAATRAVTLASLRGAYRPVVFAGSRAAVRAAVRAAEPYKRELQARGVILVPLEDDAEAADAPPKPRGFGAAAAAAADTGAAPPLAVAEPGSMAAAAALSAESRWKAPPVDRPAWASWAAQQRAAAPARARLEPRAAFYVAVALDGTVARSGAGAPRWDDLVAEFQPLDNPVAKITGV